MTRKNFQTSNIVAVSFAHLIHDVYSSFLAPILPLLIERLSISYAQAGLFNVFFRAPSLLNPFIGIWADKISVRFFIILSPVVTSICMSLLGLAPGYTLVAILLLVSGLSSALFHVPAPVLVKEISGDRVGKGMSFFMLGGELARSLGPLTILGAISLWQFEGTWKLIPMGLLASTVVYFKTSHLSLAKREHFSDKIKHPLTILKERLLFFGVICGIQFILGLMKMAFTLFLPSYLKVNGESLWFAGISLSVLEFAGAVGTIFSGGISDKIGRKSMLLLIMTLSPILMWIFILSTGHFRIIILVILGYFLFSTGPVMLALMQDEGKDHPAFFNGIFMTLNFGMNSLASFLLGVLGDYMGLNDSYRLVAVVAFAGILFVLGVPKKRI